MWRRGGKRPRRQQGKEISTKKQRFGPAPFFLHRSPWAAGLNMPGASPTECNLRCSKMYEFPNFPQRARPAASSSLKSSPLFNLCFDSTIPTTWDSGVAAAGCRPQSAPPPPPPPPDPATRQIIRRSTFVPEASGRLRINSPECITASPFQLFT